MSACVRGSLVDDGGRAGIAKPADVEFEPPRERLQVITEIDICLRQYRSKVFEVRFDHLALDIASVQMDAISKVTSRASVC